MLQCLFVTVFHSWLLILTQMSKVAPSSLIGSSRYFCSPRVLGASWSHVLAGDMSVPKAAAAKAIPPQFCGCCQNIFLSLTAAPSVKALVAFSGSWMEGLVGCCSTVCAFSSWELVETTFESEGCSAVPDSRRAVPLFSLPCLRES